MTQGATWHGTALGWNNVIDKYITKLPIVSDRFCGISLQTRTSHLLIYSLYLPTSGKDEEFLEILAEIASDITIHRNCNQSIIIGSDTNQSIKSSKRRTDAMTDFNNEFNLKSIIQSDEPTFHHNNMTSNSQIDHILYNITDESHINLNFHDHLCKLNHHDNLSSHDVIVGKIKIEFNNKEASSIDYSNTYEDFRVNKPKWNTVGLDDYQTEVNKMFIDIFTKYDDPIFNPVLSELVSKALVTSAELNFNTSKPNHSKKKILPRFSSAQKKAYEDHRKACRIWKEAGRPESKSHPTRALKLSSQKKLQETNRRENAERAMKLHNELMEVHSSDMSKVCNKLKSIRGDKTKSTTIPTIETLCGTYNDSNVLEGFCANMEKLCNRDNENIIDNEFYNMCLKDNEIIIQLTSDDEIVIPHMTLTDLKEILFKRLKLNKACDVFKLTVEHLRYAGDENLEFILILLNRIIDNINHLSSPQLNTSIATIVHKGKGKPAHLHKSYRQVRVNPLIGRLLDEYMRPRKVQMTSWQQSNIQYGFTEKITYLMGALQRNETEKYCLDNKLTFFGCSLDGESAFEVVDRSIQLRELYCAGLRGQYWESAWMSYNNSLTKVKMSGKLSRTLKETLGVKQGNINSSDDYKVYVNPALRTFEDSNLGVSIGSHPNVVTVSSTGVADDMYLMTNDQHKLQILINLAEMYGDNYLIKYGASKTKITVIGSKTDMEYYSDVRPWNMKGSSIDVVENNDHLGQIVSGSRQEGKNVDLSLKRARGSLYSLLGPAFAYKCTLSPTVQIHLYRTYTCPILRSGLASFTLRSSHIKPLSLFHRKCLKGFLHLSNSAPTPAIHFLFGELPVEAKIHRDMFSLFYSVWQNPNTKVYQIVKNILSDSDDNSSTWSINLRHICKMYNIEDPILSLKKTLRKNQLIRKML